MKSLRLIELAFHSAIPSFAIYWVAQHQPIGDALLVLSTFSVVMLWFFTFVLFQQFLYPNTAHEAFPYTLVTLLTAGANCYLGDFTFSAFSYYINTLVVLSLLLFLGSIYILRSPKVVPGKRAMVIGLLASALLVGFYTYCVSPPLWASFDSLEPASVIVIGGLFAVQALKMLIYLARSFTQKELPKQVSPLPKNLVVVATCVGVLMTGFAATAARLM